MADLSNLLGAVYGETSPTQADRDPDGPPTPVERSAAERAVEADGHDGPAVPDWADDEHLDAAFDQWKPGPADDAPDIEHELVAGTPLAAAVPLADDLAAALSEAIVSAEDDDEDEDTEDDHHSPFSRFTPEREAAVELSAATRPDGEGPRGFMAPDVEVDEPVDEPAEAPKPVSGPKLRALPSAGADGDALDLSYSDDGKKTPAPALPVSVEPMSVEPPAPTTYAAPAKWERSHDDILPTKGGGKKFFSLSLRRG